MMRQIGVTRGALALAAVIVLALAAAGSAQASAGWSWTQPMRIDSSGLAAVSCPSASLCVGVDTTGHVLATTNPTGGASSWKIADVDGAKPFVALACPSRSLCVAVDQAGNVVSSRDPTAAPSSWRITPVEGFYGLSGIACPSVSLCVVTDRRGNVVTSTDPTGGVGSWTITHVDGAVPSDCGKYQPGQDCQAQLDGVACPSTSLCVAVDDIGNAVTSTNPAGGAGAWTLASIDNRAVAGGAYSLDGVSCPSVSLCVSGDRYAADTVTSMDPTAGASAWTVTNIGIALGWASCPFTSLCLGAEVDQNGNNFISMDPAGGPSAWSALPIIDASGLTAVACPSASLCVAVDDGGNAVLGSATPTDGQIKALLLKLLYPAGKSTRIGGLMRSDGYRASFSAPSAGRITISWYLSSRTSGGHSRRRLIATGKASFAMLTATRLNIRLTRTGRQLIKHLNRVPVTVNGTLTLTGRRPVHSTARLTLKR